METPEKQDPFIEMIKSMTCMITAIGSTVSAISEFGKTMNQIKELQLIKIAEIKAEKKRQRRQKRIQFLKNIGEGILWGIAILICIAGCPLIPFVWLLVHASTIIWIWLGIDCLLTLTLIWILCSINRPNENS